MANQLNYLFRKTFNIIALIVFLGISSFDSSLCSEAVFDEEGSTCLDRRT